MSSLLDRFSHRRLNPLNGRWVLVSPQRTQRPWQGQVEGLERESRAEYDPDCYLCPGNLRAGDVVNPGYASTFVFDNDFPALSPPDGQAARDGGEDSGLLAARAEAGLCRVICFSPRHDLTIAQMSVEEIARVVEIWTAEYQALGARPDIAHVQIFENKGAMMGCSNPHPHGQIWAQSSLPEEPALEIENMRRYAAKHGKPLLLDYLAQELTLGERIVTANASFVALVPYWAVWPFEVLILPRRQVSALSELEAPERGDFAEVIRRVTVRYDNLFTTSFPYSAGIHQAPTDDGDYGACTLHMHFYPPLLRSATVRKFMVGYELLAEPQRDMTPEASATMLQRQPDIHYGQG